MSLFIIHNTIKELLAIYRVLLGGQVRKLAGASDSDDERRQQRFTNNKPLISIVALEVYIATTTAPAKARRTMRCNAVLCASLQVHANKIKICESFFCAYRSKSRQWQPCSAHYVEVPEAPRCFYLQHHSMCDLLCRACRELPGRALKGTAIVPQSTQKRPGFELKYRGAQRQYQSTTACHVY